MLGAQHSAFFAYIACALIGFGMMPCQMLPLYNLVIMKKYPSRFIVPATIILALAAVLVQSAMVEALRNHIAFIDMSYAMMMGILVMVYLRIEPYFLHTVEQKKPEHGMVETEFAEKVWEEEKPALPDEQKTSDGRALLSRREKEVMDLIANGYTNQEIADILFISVYTVNDHTKKIYKKLDVHSRLEAVQKINKLTAEEQKLHI
ncbi:MAG: LuxR family transcriptional regulator [Clostridia bacterium]|nr:LuxR family transcriptional regulator [Clostridia bacterium]